MGPLDRLRGELVGVIEWLDASRDTIVWRFVRHNNEIKMGARLTVSEGRAAVFANEGQVADVFPPGMCTRETQNLPVLVNAGTGECLGVTSAPAPPSVPPRRRRGGDRCRASRPGSAR